MLATYTPFFLYSQELFDCFHRIQQVFASAHVTLLCPFPYALLFFTNGSRHGLLLFLSPWEYSFAMLI